MTFLPSSLYHHYAYNHTIYIYKRFMVEIETAIKIGSFARVYIQSNLLDKNHTFVPVLVKSE